MTLTLHACSRLSNIKKKDEMDSAHIPYKGM